MHVRALLFALQPCTQEQDTAVNITCVWVVNTGSIAVAAENEFTLKTVNDVPVKIRFFRMYTTH
jgi:hypothetical protein